MKDIECTVMRFASSSAIYGIHKKPINELTSPLIPISNYGAMKLASEAFICSFFESYLDDALIYRFPNVVGIPATHGVVFDFIKKLESDPNNLSVLGNGYQKKIYLHVSNLVSAMLFLHDLHIQKPCLDFYNIGPSDDGIYVRDIAKLVVDNFSPSAQILFGSDNKGWVGDVPTYSFDVRKLKNTGFPIDFTSKNALEEAISELKN